MAIGSRSISIPRFSALGCCLCLLLAALSAHAGVEEDKNRAKLHFEAGLALFKIDDFAAAAAEFERSVKTFPTKNGLFNLANSYRALHRYGEALAVFERLSAEFEGKLDEEMQAHVSKQLTEIAKIVARLTIQVEPEGAVVSVDGRELGTSPLAEQLVLGPGEHEIEVSHEGYESEKRRVSLASASEPVETFTLKRLSGELTVRSNVDGASVQVDDVDRGQTPLVEPLLLPDGRHVVRITKDGYQTAEQTVVLSPGEKSSVSLALVTSLPTEEDERKMHPLFGIGLAGTATAGVASVVFWVITAKEKESYEDSLLSYDHQAPNSYKDYSYLKDRRSTTQLFNKLAVGATIATGVFAATMVLGIVISDDEEDEAPVKVTAAPGGVQVSF